MPISEANRRRFRKCFQSKGIDFDRLRLRQLRRYLKQLGIDERLLKKSRPNLEQMLARFSDDAIARAIDDVGVETLWQRFGKVLLAVGMPSILVTVYFEWWIGSGADPAHATERGEAVANGDMRGGAESASGPAGPVVAPSALAVADQAVELSELGLHDAAAEAIHGALDSLADAEPETVAFLEEQLGQVLQVYVPAQVARATEAIESLRFAEAEAICRRTLALIEIGGRRGRELVTSVDEVLASADLTEGLDRKFRGASGIAWFELNPENLVRESALAEGPRRRHLLTKAIELDSAHWPAYRMLAAEFSAERVAALASGLEDAADLAGRRESDTLWTAASSVDIADALEATQALIEAEYRRDDALAIWDALNLYYELGGVATPAYLALEALAILLHDFAGGTSTAMAWQGADMAISQMVMLDPGERALADAFPFRDEDLDLVYSQANLVQGLLLLSLRQSERVLESQPDRSPRKKIASHLRSFAGQILTPVSASVRNGYVYWGPSRVGRGDRPTWSPNKTALVFLRESKTNTRVLFTYRSDENARVGTVIRKPSGAEMGAVPRLIRESADLGWSADGADFRYPVDLELDDSAPLGFTYDVESLRLGSRYARPGDVPTSAPAVRAVRVEDGERGIKLLDAESNVVRTIEGVATWELSRRGERLLVVDSTGVHVIDMTDFDAPSTVLTPSAGDVVDARWWRRAGNVLITTDRGSRIHDLEGSRPRATLDRESTTWTYSPLAALIGWREGEEGESFTMLDRIAGGFTEEQVENSVLAAYVAGTYAPTKDADDRACRDHLTAGFEALDEGDIEQARTEFKNAGAAVPTHPEPWLGQALCDVLSGMEGEALDALQWGSAVGHAVEAFRRYPKTEYATFLQALDFCRADSTMQDGPAFSALSLWDDAYLATFSSDVEAIRSAIDSASMLQEFTRTHEHAPPDGRYWFDIETFRSLTATLDLTLPVDWTRVESDADQLARFALGLHAEYQALESWFWSAQLSEDEQAKIVGKLDRLLACARRHAVRRLDWPVESDEDLADLAAVVLDQDQVGEDQERFRSLVLERSARTTSEKLLFFAGWIRFRRSEAHDLQEEIESAFLERRRGLADYTEARRLAEARHAVGIEAAWPNQHIDMAASYAYDYGEGREARAILKRVNEGNKDPVAIAYLADIARYYENDAESAVEMLVDLLKDNGGIWVAGQYVSLAYSIDSQGVLDFTEQWLERIERVPEQIAKQNRLTQEQLEEYTASFESMRAFAAYAERSRLIEAGGDAARVDELSAIAEAGFRAASRTFPDEVLNLGTVLIGQGRFEDAREVYERSPSSKPLKTFTRDLMALDLALLDDLERYKDSPEGTAYREYTRTIELLYGWEDVAGKESYKETRRQLEQVRSDEVRRRITTRVCMMMGDMALNRDADFDEVRALFEEVLRQDPEEEWVLRVAKIRLAKACVMTSLQATSDDIARITSLKRRALDLLEDVIESAERESPETRREYVIAIHQDRYFDAIRHSPEYRALIWGR